MYGGEDLNSSHSHLSLSKQAIGGFKNQAIPPTGLLVGSKKKNIHLPIQKRVSEEGKIILTESVSSQSLMNMKGLSSNQ
jgi:hypothetical protein